MPQYTKRTTFHKHATHASAQSSQKPKVQVYSYSLSANTSQNFTLTCMRLLRSTRSTTYPLSFCFSVLRQNIKICSLC